MREITSLGETQLDQDTIARLKTQRFCQLTYADKKATCAVCRRTYAAPNGKTTAICRPVVPPPQKIQTTLLQEKPGALKKRQPPMNGPGTELKKLLARFGIHATPNCSCTARMWTMNEKGCDWCAENLNTISNWLHEEAAKRKLPYLDIVGKTLTRLAIYRARKKEQKKQDADQTPPHNPDT